MKITKKMAKDFSRFYNGADSYAKIHIWKNGTVNETCFQTGDFYGDEQPIYTYDCKDRDSDSKMTAEEAYEFLNEVLNASEVSGPLNLRKN